MATTDRELLEAAARTAEYSVGDWLPGLGMMLYEGSAGSYSKRRWNPLTDDGDALRLAVKLGLEVFPTDMEGWAASGTPEFHIRAPHNQDRLAATRRAIVRAAAAMAKA